MRRRLIDDLEQVLVDYGLPGDARGGVTDIEVDDRQGIRVTYIGAELGKPWSRSVTLDPRATLEPTVAPVIHDSMVQGGPAEDRLPTFRFAVGRDGHARVYPNPGPVTTGGAW